MWKGESPEVRAKYHEKALQIKAHLMALYPNYRYAPRKSSEIRRRAPRRGNKPPFQHNAHQKPVENLMEAGVFPTSDITRRVPGSQQFLPPISTPGWTPYHLMNGTSAQATTPAQASVAEDHSSAENTPIEDTPEIAMNAERDYQVAVDRFLDNWDIEADLAQIMAEI